MADSAEIGQAMQGAGDVTDLLLELRAGNTDAMARLLPVVYRELRRLAAHYMRQERPGHTLQPTALVHEAYLRLVGQTDRNWQNRGHFFAVAAQAMRAVLVDHARANLARKRGGGQVPVQLDHRLKLMAPEPRTLVVLDEALTRLEEIDPRAAHVVELRLFLGLAVEEAAQVMGISEKTVRRDWNFAKAWLQTELDGKGL